jgi:hypothetical protein
MASLEHRSFTGGGTAVGDEIFKPNPAILVLCLPESVEAVLATTSTGTDCDAGVGLQLRSFTVGLNA